MIYRRRKHSECLNCRAKLDSVYNYCPLCGQENTDNKVNFKTLVVDFFNNYLSLDSRFGKSFKPFLLKPGLLTNEFIVGHRVSFMHPIRLYLVMSLFYFFVISLPGLKDENADQKEDTGSVELSPNIITLGDRSTSTLLSDSLIASNDTIVDTKQENDTDSLDTEFWIFTSANANIFNDMRLNREFSDQQVLDSLNTDEMSFGRLFLPSNSFVLQDQNLKI